jgi:predicted ArsR family transcriptional regulator
MDTPSKGHGNRKHLQILLAPHRGKLFVEHAETLEVKPTALIRHLIYEYLRTNTDKDIYNEALKKDEEDWKQSVQNRLEGRALSKLLRSIQNS